MKWHGSNSLGYIKNHVIPAPPRVQNALTALLKPLQGLKHISLSYMEFASVMHLFKVIYTLPHLQSLSLHAISFSRSSERICWPPTSSLSKLRKLDLSGAYILIPVLLAFVSLGLRGTPNIPSPSAVSIPCGIVEALVGLFHPEDQAAIIQLAQDFIHLHSLTMAPALWD